MFNTQSLPLDIQDMINRSRTVGGQYATLHNYESDGTGRIATYYLRVGVSRAWAYAQALLWLDEENIDHNVVATATGIDPKVCLQGLNEQRDSWDDSVTTATRRYAYATRIQTVSGTNLFNLYKDKQGVIHPEKGLYFHAHITGPPVESKPGVYKKRNSADKTIAKNWIRKNSPASKFRTFRLTPDSFDWLVFGRMTVMSTDTDNVVAAIL